MYSFDLKNVVPLGDLTWLFAKATIDESNLWHRRLGHINFNTMNKLVRGNLVRGLPSKLFENDHTCVACQKGKQHKASFYVRSINRKSHCLVATDDFSRFSWVFFLATKDETLEILKNIITGIENQSDHKVKTIKSDNGTEFKNKIMNEFYEMKGRKPALSFMRPFRCPVIILNTLDHLGTKENIDAGQAEMNTVPGPQYVLLPFLTYDSQSPKNSEDEVADDAGKKNEVVDPAKEDDINGPGEATNTNRLNTISSPVNVVSSSFTTVDPGRSRDQRNEFESVFGQDKDANSTYRMFTPVSAAESSYENLGGSTPVNDATPSNVDYPTDPLMPDLEDTADLQDTSIFGNAYEDEDVGAEAGLNNLETTMNVSPIPTSRRMMESSLAKITLIKDEEAEDVDVHLYRSMIGSLMYLTASRPDIMFVVCACVRFQVTPKTSHLHAVKRIFRYLKGQPKLGLWYPRYSPFDLEAFSDSDYAGASLDRKSTIGAEYVAAANCCGQVLWIQNQMLDYGFNFMNTKIYIDNESTICIVKNPVFHSKTKHIEIRHNFIRDFYEKKLIQVIKIHTDQMLLDSSLQWLLMLAEENAEFHQIVDFLSTCSINYALTVSPTIYASYIEQFWNTATSKTVNSVKQIHAIVDGKAVVISESSVRSDLLFNDEDGIACLTNDEIFENLALMGYEQLSTKLTFQKGSFSPQWKFLIHTILHCISSKSTAWNEFSTNLASAVICLAKGQKFNFSKLIFDGMLRNLDPKRFLMYPRKSKHFSRKVTPLFDSILVQTQAPEGEGSAIPPVPQPTPSTSQPNVSKPQTESLQTETPLIVFYELQTEAHIEQILPSLSTYQRKQSKTQKHKRAKKVIELPRTSVPLDHEANEVVHKEGVTVWKGLSLLMLA
ncbi:putative ribonuclease H-like domain-containing protein [Tanacetum coccineum]